MLQEKTHIGETNLTGRMTRRIPAASCLMMGAVGCALAALAGVLMMLGQGAASYLRVAAFALYGAMLLFLAAAQLGAENKKVRIRLLVLFFVWMLSYLNLPPLGELCAMLGPVVFAGWWRRGRWFGLWLGQLAAELLQAVVLTVTVMPEAFGAWRSVVVGFVVLLAAALRGALLLMFYRREKAEPEVAPPTPPGAQPPGALG